MDYSTLRQIISLASMCALCGPAWFSTFYDKEFLACWRCNVQTCLGLAEPGSIWMCGIGESFTQALRLTIKHHRAATMSCMIHQCSCRVRNYFNLVYLYVHDRERYTCLFFKSRKFMCLWYTVSNFSTPQIATELILFY